jgi:hypothetical protein
MTLPKGEWAPSIPGLTVVPDESPGKPPTWLDKEAKKNTAASPPDLPNFELRAGP